MSWIKLKFALSVTTATFVAGSGIAAALWGAGQNHPTAKEILAQVQDKYAALSSYSDTGKTFSEAEGEAGGMLINSMRLARPNWYHLVGASPKAPAQGTACWHSGDNNAWLMTADARYKNEMPPGALPHLHVLFPSAPIPCTFFGKRDWDSMGRLMSSRNLSRLEDERIRGIDCYKVLATPMRMGISEITFWIGKGDSLIHQVRYTITGRPTNRIATGEGASARPARTFANDASTIIQTHENISVNRAVSKRDFIYEPPAGQTAH